MGVFSFLSPKDTETCNELPEIYGMSIRSDYFTRLDVHATYTKILTDVLERTHGIPKEVSPLLWDNYVQGNSQAGLITLLVQAMVEKSDLFLVYKKSLGTLRIANNEEQQKIRADYAKSGKSTIGTFISFRNYSRTDMLYVYSELEYCILASLNKTVNIAQAVQIKMSDLRSSVSLADASIPAAQAKSMASALKRGSDIFLDAKDEITTASPNIDPTEKAIAFLDAKRAYYLDLPLSYVSGKQTTGIGTTGEADMRALERGLKQYFFSIVQPVLKEVFGCDTEFKSQDFRTLTGALEALKTFELVGEEILSSAAKKEILARLFDLDPELEEKNLEADAKEAEANPEPEEDEDDQEPGTGERGSFGGARA